ncbi:hypothetical protein [Pseudomonas syringae]|uniref:hypothetical protein n=1 Tax=Pseudomonas syringae TaxID=317 RepID=UPI0006B8DBD6|nr:hypothetical protein [Pseudomonas syringae]
MVKEVFFPGNDRQPCLARYGIKIDPDHGIARAEIVVIQTNREGYPAMGTSLYNTEDGRNIILNKILETDLRGVRVEFVSFYVILDLEHRLEGLKLPIRMDFEDYIKRGNPYGVESLPAENIAGKVMQWIGKGDKAYVYHSIHVQGGCAKFYTDLMDEQRESVSTDKAKELFQAIGYEFSPATDY